MLKKTIFALVLLSMKAAPAAIISETVGQVADHVVTSREVQISSVVENVLFPGKNKSVSIVEINPGLPEFQAALTNVLLEAVVSLEAENFNVTTLSDSDLLAATTKVERAVAGKKYWTKLEVSQAELRKFTQRKLNAKNFLKFKTNSMSGIITDQEALAYYEKNRVKFGGTSFATFKDNIKSFLAQQQLEDGLRSWFEVIKRKYKVRNFLAGE